jgi:rubredoxin
MIKKWICSVCGYVYEGPTPPEECPVCHQPASKFNEVKEEMVWAAEHVVGVAKGVR